MEIGWISWEKSTEPLTVARSRCQIMELINANYKSLILDKIEYRYDGEYIASTIINSAEQKKEEANYWGE